MNNQDQLAKRIQKALDQIQPEVTSDSYQNYDGEDKIISTLELIERIKNQPEPAYRIFSGFNPIDQATTGFKPGQLITISAPTGHGKTKFCETLNYNFYQQGHTPLWFPFEMSAEEILNRMGSNYPQFYMPAEMKGNDIEWIKQRTLESIAKYKTKLVFIDHLHYIIPPGAAATNNASLVIGQAVRELKLMAVKNSITIFLIAHTKKPGYNEPLSVNSLRDSSFIAQESDFVFMLNRESSVEDGMTVSGDTTWLALQKNRSNGKELKVPMKLHNSIFVPKSHQEQIAEQKDNANFFKSLIS